MLLVLMMCWKCVQEDMLSGVQGILHGFSFYLCLWCHNNLLIIDITYLNRNVH